MNGLSRRVVDPAPASLRELQDFHSKQYLACLQKLANGTVDDEELEEFGLGVLSCKYRAEQTIKIKRLNLYTALKIHYSKSKC